MKYIIEFSKTGVICYTSHLDIMKVFKRAFKKADVRLAYSQGFNPHPKMGFAQPLSLGYEGLQEYLEFETVSDADEGEEILKALKAIMPEGLELLSIRKAPDMKKTLAAETSAARYEIKIPVPESYSAGPREIYSTYMGNEEITALKKQKKKKEPVSVNIKPKIREITFNLRDSVLFIDTLLDSGSNSNLSPELIITTVLQALKLETPRNEIEVRRVEIQFGE